MWNDLPWPYEPGDRASDQVVDGEWTATEPHYGAEGHNPGLYALSDSFMYE